MNLEKLQAFRIPDAVQSYTWRDSSLYALGLGYGADPVDEADLAYVLETEQRTVPSMAATLAYPGFWMREPALEVDWVRLLNGQVGFTIHRQLPPEGTVKSASRIIAVDDKGKDKGAAVFTEKQLTGTDGVPYATIQQAVFLRGDGGYGGFGTAPEPPPPVVGDSPDHAVEVDVARNAALIYRLSGDLNPVHSHPAIARQAGFREPIVHGMCSLGMACRVALRLLCSDRPEGLRSMSVRFASVVYPGERLRFEFFGSGPRFRWRVRVPQRNVTVLDRGELELAL
jgi:acyl dehydratase